MLGDRSSGFSIIVRHATVRKERRVGGKSLDRGKRLFHATRVQALDELLHTITLPVGNALALWQLTTRRATRSGFIQSFQTLRPTMVGMLLFCGTLQALASRRSLLSYRSLHEWCSVHEEHPFPCVCEVVVAWVVRREKGWRKRGGSKWG